MKHAKERYKRGGNMLRIGICDDSTDARDSLRLQLEKDRELKVPGQRQLSYSYGLGAYIISNIHERNFQ